MLKHCAAGPLLMQIFFSRSLTCDGHFMKTARRSFDSMMFTFVKICQHMCVLLVYSVYLHR